MEKSGFLEKLYQGVFDRAFFDACQGLNLSEKARDIQKAYSELAQTYQPSELEAKGELPDALWQGLKETGMFALTIPEAYGGSGLGLSDYLSIIEAAASHDLALAIIPIAHHSIGLKGLLLYGSEDQKQAYLPSAAAGDTIFAYALTEPETGSDAKHIQSFAEKSPDGGHYILNGVKTYITNGGYAGALTVFAQMDKAKPGYMGAFIVETGWDGVKIGKDMPKMGLKISSTTMIRFTNVKVPRENLIGRPGDGFKIAMTILNYGRLGLAAASTGLMNQSSQEMLKRANKRRQFGSPLSEFELVREKIVNARVNAFISKAMTAFTAGMLEKDENAQAAIESSHAKLFSTTRAWEVLYDALQVHGGSGYLKSLPYEKRLRDFRVTTVFEGTTEIHSIYPPLFLLRRMGKALKNSGGKWGFLLKAALDLFKSPQMDLDFSHPVLKKAAREARLRIRKLRYMLIMGMVYYGQTVVKHEFYLRRATHLSIQVYILTSSIAFILKIEEQGGDAHEYWSLLDYYMADIRAASNKSAQVRPDLREKRQHQIFKAIQAAEKHHSK